MPPSKNHAVERSLFTGFIRLHVVHHAAIAPIYGLEIIEELRRHGYAASPGTIYPILHDLEGDGWLRSSIRAAGRSRRKMYVATPRGKRSLEQVRKKLRELARELL